MKPLRILALLLLTSLTACGEKQLDCDDLDEMDDSEEAKELRRMCPRNTPEFEPSPKIKY